MFSIRINTVTKLNKLHHVAIKLCTATKIKHLITSIQEGSVETVSLKLLRLMNHRIALIWRLWLIVPLKCFSTVDNSVLPGKLSDVEAGPASLKLSGGIDCLAASRLVSCETLSFRSSSSSSSSFRFTVSSPVTVRDAFLCSRPWLPRSSSHVPWHSVALDEVRGASPPVGVWLPMAVDLSCKRQSR